MNPFTTDHPLTTQPTPRWMARLQRGVFCFVIVWPIYLLLLGPFWALDGCGYFKFVPEPVRYACYLPAAPIMSVPHLRGRFADYLDWWYLDPNAPDRETGWD